MLTYLLLITCWMSLALGVLAPWIVDLLAPKHNFTRSAEAVPLLCFATAAYSGYTVLAIGIGRARQTQYNWIVTGLAAAVNIALNVVLIPRYGMMGAAVATLVAYLALFVGMWLNSRRVYPVPYQWRRVMTLSSVAAGLTADRLGGRLASGRDRPRARLPARSAAARLLPAGRARGACAASRPAGSWRPHEVYDEGGVRCRLPATAGTRSR